MVKYAEDRPTLPAELTKDIGKWAHNLQFQDLPEEVVEKLKFLCLDWIVSTTGGITIPTGTGIASLGGTRPARKALAERVTGPATVLGTNITTEPEYAALVNGASDTMLDLSDMHIYSVPTHIGTSSFAAALATAEIAPVDFPTFATAVTIGFEVMAKMAMALQPGKYTIDVQPVNTMGCAIQTGKMLGLSEEQVVSCLGMAGFLTCGSWEWIGPGYTCRGMTYGWHAHSGVIIGLWVREGLVGQPTMVEGPYGFLNSHSELPDPEPLARLGEPYEILQVGVKIYPSSRYVHAALDAILSMVEEHDIKPSDVEEVVIEVPKPIHDAIGREERRHPEIPEQGRVNAFWQAASAIVTRRAWLENYESDVFDSPEVRALAERVTCTHRQEFDAEWPTYKTATTIRLKDGASHAMTIAHPKGEPENPLSWEELVDKCNALYESTNHRAWTERRHEEIIERARNLEAESSMGDFVKLLATDKGFAG